MFLASEATLISRATRPSRPTSASRLRPHSATNTRPSGNGWQEWHWAAAGALYSQTTSLSRETSLAPF